MHGHLAARLDPLGLRAARRPGPRPGHRRTCRRELMARIPASVLRVAVPGETFADALPNLAGHLLRHDRLRDRAHLRPQPARVAAPGDRVGRAPQAALEPRRSARCCERLSAGRGARELPAQGLPRQEAVLDRGPRRAGADARRDDRAGLRERRARGRARHGAPRPAERAGAHRRPARTSRSSSSSRASRRCTPTPPRPRAAPAT